MIVCFLFGWIPFVFIVLIAAKSTSADTIDSLNPVGIKILPNLDRRSINTSLGEIAVHDSQLEKAWYSGNSGGIIYRLSSLSDGKPAAGQCGTLYPIYLNGQFPDLQHGKEVDVEVCLVSFLSECERSDAIKLRQSMGDTQYYLSPTGGTSAYCFEQIGAAAPAPNYTIPETPLVKADLRYTNDGDVRIPNLEFTCDFVPSSTESYYYSISWYVNNNFLKDFGPTLSEDISQTKLTENDLLDNALSLGFNLKCGIAVSAELAGMRTTEQFSDSFFAGVEVSQQTIDVHRGQRGSFYVRPTIPLGCGYNIQFPSRLQECSIALSTVDITREFDQTCIDNDPLIGTVSSVHCGVELQGQQYTECEETSGLCPKMTYDRQLITIKPINDFHSYGTKISFALLLKTRKFNNGNRIWQDYQIQTIHVNMIDDQRWAKKSCWAHSDPQMLTFDKTEFENQQYGEFILYKHNNQQIEVQYKTRFCDLAASQSCICSVVVRAGGDMWTYTICENVKFIGFLSCKEGILDVHYNHYNPNQEPYNHNQETYTVHFPTGTYMEVYLHWYTGELNLDIYSSPEDIGQTQGHCGFLNDDDSDDLQDRNGVHVNVDDFLEAWRINPDDSFLKVKNHDPEVWQTDHYICVCPNLSGDLSNEIVCSPKQTASCSITEKEKENGQSSICISRRKRSVIYERKEIERRFAVFNADVSSNHRHKKSTGADNGKTYEEGYEECLQFFRGQRLYDLRDSMPETKLNESISACARDASYSAGESPWSRSHFEGWAIAIGNEIQRNKTFRTTETEAVTLYKTTYCPEDCNNNGHCLNGVCKCNDSFAGTTCFIRTSDFLTIQDIEGDGVCDISEGDHCHECHRFQTEYLTDAFKCRIGIYEVDLDGNSKLVDNFEQMGEFENIFEGYCCPHAESSRKKRSSISNDFVVKYEISVSNDGEHFGPSRTVIVFDSTCQIYDVIPSGELSFGLKNGFCFIDGSCYKHGDKYTTSDCDVCNTDRQLFQWSNGCLDEEKNGDDSKDEEGNSPHKTIVIVACSVSGVVVIAIAIVATLLLKYCKSQRSVSDSSPSLGHAPMNKLYGQTELQNKYLESHNETVLSPTYLSLDVPLSEPPAYETIMPTKK